MKKATFNANAEGRRFLAYHIHNGSLRGLEPNIEGGRAEFYAVYVGMNDIKEELCYAMHKFVKEHISEMNRPASDLCIEWKNEKQMLRDIRKNFSDAVWALGELLTWGLSKDYCTELFLVCTYEDEQGFDRDICKIVDRKGRERFFRCFYPECEIVEVKQVTKMVEMTFWEEV